MMDLRTLANPWKAMLDKARATTRDWLPTPDRSPGILVVEDESAIRRLLVQVLGAVGYRIQSVAEGALAIRILEEDPAIDLVLADLAMPGLKGQDVAEWVVRTRPDVKVVCMSGSPDDSDGRLGRLLDRCVVHFLPKPFLPSQALALVQRLLGSR